jgi:hypothetical protein
MKKCSISVIIKEMQIKTAMRYHFLLIRMSINKKTKEGCVDKKRLDCITAYYMYANITQTPLQLKNVNQNKIIF